MAPGLKTYRAVALALVVFGGAAVAEPPHESVHSASERPAGHAAEPHPGPQGYQRVAEPHGWNNRPAAVDQGAYHHNFQAARSFRVGPYHRPPGWVERQWGYGQILPRVFWGSDYILADYWLFALEVPPVGYEWVRYGSDALLVNTSTGEVLQAEYGVFS